MSKDYQKPKYVPEDTLIATKLGWCYIPNNNEVLVAVGYLDEKLAAQEGEPPILIADPVY